jgi:endogenous inhibitor of DNA gyrase (YacG/DUF329 family)
MSTFKCPTCKRKVPAPDKNRGESKWFPFCSERCKLIDLGKWFDAEYSVPVEPDTDEDEGSESRGP